MHLLINGGGLVGSLAALFMLKYTNDVTVAEKRSDIRMARSDTGRSINMVLTSRGLYALRQVGLEAQALAIAVPVEGRIMHTTTTTSNNNSETKKDSKTEVISPVASTRVVFQPYGVSPQEVNYSISRTALNQLLINEAERRGVKFLFNHDLVQLRVHHDHSHKHSNSSTVTAHYAGNGALSGRIFKIDADICFGTDGVGSPTRGFLLQHLREKRHSIDVPIAPDAHDTIQRLGISYKELKFPARQEQYSMNHKGLHIWPRGAHFLMALADLKNTFTGTLYLPDGSASLAGLPDTSEVPTFEQLGSDKEKTRQYIETTYPDIPQLVPDYLEQLASRPHSFLATIRCTHWCYDSSLLIFGDAAHGITPFFGQGMNLGFESVVILDRFLSHLPRFDSKHRMDIAEAFAAFEQYHHPAADAIADMAIENFSEMSYKVSQQDFLQRKAIENVCEKLAPEHFRSRYYMVTKTLIPYQLVQQAGPCVEKCITELQEQYSSNIQQLTKEAVIAVANKHLKPFLDKHHIKIEDPMACYYPAAGPGVKKIQRPQKRKVCKM